MDATNKENFKNECELLFEKYGMPKDEVKHVESYFLVLDAPYGRSVEGFFKWRKELEEKFRAFMMMYQLY